MLVCVTGSSGHVGGNLVRGLLAAGHEVRAMVRDDRRAIDGTGAGEVHADILDPASLKRAFSGVEIVFHCAAKIALSRFDEDGLREVNVAGTRNVVSACLAAGVRRLIHFSTVHAFCGEPTDLPIDESRPLARDGECLAYDFSKVLGDREVAEGLDRGLDAVVVHPAGVIGPLDWKPSNMGAFFVDLCSGRIPALVPGAYDFVDVRDVAASAIAAADRGVRGERYLLSGHRVTVREVSTLACDASGAKLPRLTMPSPIAHIGAPFIETWGRVVGRRPIYTRAALVTLASNSSFVRDKAGRVLGHDPRPMADTVRDTISWFREARMIP